MRFSPVLTAILALSLPYGAWADSFTDALEATYKNNPTIKAERERQKATDEDVAQALSGFRPTASANYSKGRQRTAFGGGGWTYGSTEGKSLRVEQPLFKGGGTLSSYNSAKQRVRSGAFRLSGVEQQVMLNAITSYMDVVRATSILELSRNNEEVLSKQLGAARERFDVGEVTRTDVAQSEARLSNARTQVIAAEGQLISAIAAFDRTVGYKPEGLLVQPSDFPQLPATLEEALAQADQANPELMEAVHAAKSSHYDVWTNKSALLPKVSLVGSMSRQEGAGVLGTSKFDQDSIGVEVSIPLYQSGAEYSRVREAKNIERQRNYTVQDTRQTTEQSVTHAWEQLETAISTIKTRDEQINAAEIALDGVRQEQEYGARTVLDVLDAEQELFVAKTNLVQAQRDRVVAAYNLLLTLGKLTPANLQLAVQQYDPQEHYDDVKWQFIGF
jgi:outer membrane protein